MLTFLLRETWLNLTRQRLLALACASTAAIALTTLAAFLIVAWHVNALAEDIPRRFEVHVFLNVGAPRAQAQRLVARVRALPGVARVRLVPRETAWAEYRSRYPYPEDLDGLADNPLPDKLEVSTARPQDTLRLAEELRKWSQVAHVNEGRQALHQLLAITGIVRTVSLGLAVLLAVGAVAVVGNMIRVTLFARRRDIRVMQLVGATNGMIRLPFVLEGLAEGLLGGAAAAGITYGGVRYAQTRLLPDLPFMREFQLTLSLPLVCSALVVAGALLGLIGSLISLQRFLRPE